MENINIKAVTVTDNSDKPQDIGSVNDAVEFLLKQWPVDNRGPAYMRARIACKGALDENSLGAEAREAFVNAATQAGILVETSGWWRKVSPNTT